MIKMIAFAVGLALSQAGQIPSCLWNPVCCDKVPPAETTKYGTGFSAECTDIGSMGGLCNCEKGHCVASDVGCEILSQIQLVRHNTSTHVWLKWRNVNLPVTGWYKDPEGLVATFDLQDFLDCGDLTGKIEFYNHDVEGGESVVFTFGCASCDGQIATDCDCEDEDK